MNPITESQWNEISDILRKDISWERIKEISKELRWANKLIDDKKVYKEQDLEEKKVEAIGMLTMLGVDRVYIQKTTSLAFLALCNITPESNWKDSSRASIKNSDMVKFAMEYYNLKESSNNRDSFRREGVNILLNSSIIDLNPDNQLLGPNSPLTHYAIKESVLTKIKNYGNK